MLTRVRMIPTLIIFGLVAGAGLAAMRAVTEDPKTRTDDRHELVSYVATFEPTKRLFEVQVSVWENGPKGSDVTNRSPWIRESMVAPGTVVRMTVVQSERGVLRCKIRKGLKVLARNDNTSSGSSTILCEATV